MPSTARTTLFATPVAPVVALRPLLTSLEAELNGLFFEREDAIGTVLTTVLAGENGFMEGLPGTGKSDLLETICSAVTGGKYARFLMDRQMGKEDLFGAHDIAQYLAGGGWTRDTSDTMVDAHMVLLDEVGRTGPAVMGSMLTIMNEKKYKPNGHWITVPMISAWGASNSWIFDEMPAMADRFLVNMSLDFIKEEANVAKLFDRACDNTRAAISTAIPLGVLQHAIVVDVPKVVIPQGLRDTMLQLKSDLRAEQIELSDRRWYKTFNLLKAAAYRAGKTVADEDDLPILRHVVWTQPDQRKTAERKVMALTSPITKAAMELATQVDSIAAEIDARRGKSVADRAAYGAQAQFDLEQIEAALSKQVEAAHRKGRPVTALDGVRVQIKGVRTKIFTDCMNFTPAQAAGLV